MFLTVAWVLCATLFAASALLGVASLIGTVVLFALGGMVGTLADNLLPVAVVAGLFVLAAVCAYLCRLILRKQHALDEAARGGAPRQIIRMTCAVCGDDDVVQGHGGAGWEWWRCCVARCLTCGKRYKVHRSTWTNLPEANPGDPFETYNDQAALMHRVPLSAAAVVSLLGIVAASAFVAWLCADLAIRILPKLRPFDFFLICTSSVGFYIWVRLFLPKRKPGRRCVKCAYDLRACSGPVCPECGTPFDPQLVAGRTGPTAGPVNAASSPPPSTDRSEPNSLPHD